MSKRIVTLIGAVACGGVLLLSIALGVVPLLSQVLNTTAQNAQVAMTNASYQQQIAVLEEQAERLDEINTSISALRQGISAAPQLDDVFDLVAQAAQSSGVTVESIEAGEAVPFAQRTAALGADEAAAEASVPTEPPPEATATPEAPAEADPVPVDGGSAVDVTGRSQVDFTIRVDAADMAQAVAFLDALRANPRLFSVVDTLVSSTGIVLDVDLTGLAYFLPEG